MNNYFAFAIAGIDEIRPGDCISNIILNALGNYPMMDGDIFVITHKIVSKSESCIVDISKVHPSQEAMFYAGKTGKDPRLVQVILDQSECVISYSERGILICRHKLGFICANAGVDCSNAFEKGYVTLLPLNPDLSAERIRVELEEKLNVRIGVVICDTHGRAFRLGACGIAIGMSGIAPMRSYIGEKDRRGYVLQSSIECVADEIAAAATLIMGQADEGVPVVLFRGGSSFLGNGTISSILRPEKEDLFVRKAKQT